MLLAAALALSLSQPTPIDPAQSKPEILWERSLGAAKVKSIKEKKPVIVYFTTSNCTTCDRMEEDVFGAGHVVDASRNFVWAKLDRESDPFDVKRYDVRRFPTFIVLGDKDENVLRFDGLLTANMLHAYLQAGFQKYQQYLRGEEWYEPPYRAESISDTIQYRTLPMPMQELSGGMTFHKGKLVVVQGDSMFSLDPATGEHGGYTHVPAGITDITSDGQFIYALDYSWSAGGPIHVIDPENGARVHQIFTEANKAEDGSSALGIAYHEGRLYVAARANLIYEVELETGIILREVPTTLQFPLLGMTSDGGRLCAATKSGIAVFDGKSLEGLHFAYTRYALRSCAYGDGEFYVCEQPVFGHNKMHQYVRVYPETYEIYALTYDASRDPMKEREVHLPRK